MKRKLVALALFALGCVALCLGLKLLEAPDWMAFMVITIGVCALAVLLWIVDQEITRHAEKRAIEEDADEHAKFLTMAEVRREEAAAITEWAMANRAMPFVLSATYKDVTAGFAAAENSARLAREQTGARRALPAVPAVLASYCGDAACC